jgi:hypothetical protein
MLGFGFFERINAIAGVPIFAVSEAGGGGSGAMGSSLLVSMPTRAAFDAAKLEALLWGHNPCDRICACSCCCRGAVQVCGAW